MPSDSKKREQARKKEAQKKRGSKITTVTSKDANGTNGTTNGVELTEEGSNIIYLFTHGFTFETTTFSHFGDVFLFIVLKQRYCVQSWSWKHGSMVGSRNTSVIEAQ